MQQTDALQPASLSPALRAYVYFTAAVVGGAIMIIEILGAKMLSPYIGLSHFVWTAQIAGTLLALALGYYVGGWLADKLPRMSVAYWAIVLAAAYLAMTVAICEPVAYWCLDFKPLALGSLLSSLILFFVPLALLATVGPFFVRMLTCTVGSIGGNVGRLIAVGTLGSFVGTILIGYLLIPLLPNSWTMYLTAIVLALVSLIYFVVWRGDVPHLGPIVFVTCATALAGYREVRLEQLRHSRAEDKFYGNSNFGVLQVVEENAWRYYLNDFLPQNTYDPSEQKSLSLFSYMLHGLASGYTPEINDVLCIGLGAGIVPMEFARDGVQVDVVEINPAVVPLARRWFDLEPSKLNITIGDGREFLNRCTKKYDAVLLDAFLGESSPSHLMTREAFGAIRGVLKPNGTLVINTFGSLAPGDDFCATSIYRTLATVFKNVRIHTAGGRNIFYVASDRELEIVHPPDLRGVHHIIRSKVEAAWAGVIEPGLPYGDLALHLENARVLTDDFNPVDFYDAHNRERWRRDLAMHQARRRGFQAASDE